MECASIFPGKPFVIIQSVDGNYWIVSEGKARKVSNEKLCSVFRDCETHGRAQVCWNARLVAVWSPNGKSAIGAFNVDPGDEEVWCYLFKLARLVNDKLPEHVRLSDIERAKIRVVPIKTLINNLTVEVY